METSKKESFLLSGSEELGLPTRKQKKWDKLGRDRAVIYATLQMQDDITPHLIDLDILVPWKSHPLLKLLAPSSTSKRI